MFVFVLDIEDDKLLRTPKHAFGDIHRQEGFYPGYNMQYKLLGLSTSLYT